MEDDCHRVHTSSALIIQKIYQILAGYYTDDCADFLRYEPPFTEILGEGFSCCSAYIISLKHSANRCYS